MIFFTIEPYADTLLALGICAAFDVTPDWKSGNYDFPAEGSEPIQFPFVADDPVPPFTFHKFHAVAVKNLGGRGMIESLEKQWNETQPTYDEIIPLVCNPSTNWSKTRFWSVESRWTGAATFRPTGSKGSVDEPTLKEFWLLDALRAIGFFTYASPKLLMKESPLARWLVFVPVVPDTDFQYSMLHTPDLEIGSRVELQAHIVGSRYAIPRIQVAQYAELNPLARTLMRLYALEPRHDLENEPLDELQTINYNMKYYSIADQQKLTRWLIEAVERRSTKALARFVPQWNMDIEVRGYRSIPVSTNLISALLI